jgi:hypothetical protein
MRLEVKAAAVFCCERGEGGPAYSVPYILEKIHSLTLSHAHTHTFYGPALGESYGMTRFSIVAYFTYPGGNPIKQI